MAVYVDALRAYRTLKRLRHLGPRWCHLLADSPDELHTFASRLGLKRKWFQDRRWPHYDLTPGKRILAIRLGALEVRRTDWIRERKGGQQMTRPVFASQANPEGPDNPQELGCEWYCSACRALVVPESVSYEQTHTCGARLTLLSPDQIMALDDAGDLSIRHFLDQQRGGEL